MCNLNVIVVLEYISRDIYLLFAIRSSSKFQNSVFYQHLRPKSGLKSPSLLALIGRAVSEEKMFEYYGNIHVYCPGVGPYKPLGSTFFRFSPTDYCLQDFHLK